MKEDHITFPKIPAKFPDKFPKLNRFTMNKRQELLSSLIWRTENKLHNIVFEITKEFHWNSLEISKLKIYYIKLQKCTPFFLVQMQIVSKFNRIIVKFRNKMNTYDGAYKWIRYSAYAYHNIAQYTVLYWVQYHLVYVCVFSWCKNLW